MPLTLEQQVAALVASNAQVALNAQALHDLLQNNKTQWDSDLQTAVQAAVQAQGDIKDLVDSKTIERNIAARNVDDLGTYLFARSDDGWLGGARLPDANHAYSVISMQGHVGDFYSQLHFDLKNRRVGARYAYDSPWSEIVELWDSGHVPNIDKLAIDSSGRLTIPAQPVFSMRVQNTPVAANTSVIISGGTTNSNRGGHLDVNTGRFTAPVDGVYEFTVTAVRERTLNDIDSPRVVLRKNGVEFNATLVYGPAYNGGSITEKIEMLAGDYVEAAVVAVNDEIGDLWGATFSGHLIA